MKNLDYGVIGNCTTAALVSRTGSIDFCCLPYFDSSSVFAALLDEERGGRFAIEPAGGCKITQEYLRRTNILVTRFARGADILEVFDFMPRYRTESGAYHCPPDIVRYLHVVSGRPKVRIRYEPRPGYAQHPVRRELSAEFLKYYTTAGKYESVYLYSDLSLADIADGRPITLTEDRYLLMSYNQKIVRLDVDYIRLEYERTKVYWMGWLARTDCVTAWPRAVQRSALVLKMLTFQKTGAILAAVTTSLPETIGEVRNWDYRYCWLRDAGMTISVLTRLGHYSVAKRFLNFILDIVPYKDEKIQIMYGIRRNRTLPEMELDWLRGYEGSRPVRIGNSAHFQKQNDIYGVLMDVIYQSFRLFYNTLDYREDLWTVVRTLTRHIYNNWRKTDSGIWEFRSERRHFVFSKILCWAGMDRAVSIARFFGKSADAENYARLRDAIRADILKKGVHPKTGALVQYYGGDSLDAANLLAEHYGFCGAGDPIYVRTVEQTWKHLSIDGLMYRYREADDFGVPRSSFTVCTFWMIKALYRIGRCEEAVAQFERLLGYSNPLGLYSEDLDFKSKRLLGNFPQGYTHLALIDTALALSDTPAYGSGAETFLPSVPA